MTDPRAEYVRVNVSSATSPSRFNVYGDKIAEVEMLLPTNLISIADKVDVANMAIMKLFVPMAAVPQNSAPLPPLEEVEVITAEVPSKMKIGFICGGWNGNTGSFHITAHDAYFNSPIDHDMTTVCFDAKHSHETGEGERWGRYELSNGEHEISSINELLCAINIALQVNLEDYHGDHDSPIPQISFQVETDNTITLRCLPRGAHTVLPPSMPPVQVDDVPFIFKEGVGANKYHADNGWIVANEELRNMLPSLPWIKTHIELPEGSTVIWPEFVYILDTREANVSITQNYCQIMIGSDDGGSSSKALTPHYISLVSYHFVASDVMSLTNISSFVVTLDGASFNQQVYPVNFRPSTVSAIQTGTVPIIEVYYPILSTPAEFTTDLIVAKDAFSNAAPIKINPSLLKERSLKFKVWMILKDGRMKEVVIPANSVLQLQICFELFPKA